MKKLLEIVAYAALVGVFAVVVKLLLTYTAKAAEPPRFSGIAAVVDADTIRVSGRPVRLCGINAEEANTRAGRMARAWVTLWLEGLEVHCTQVGHGTPCDGRSQATNRGRTVAQCFLGDEDIAYWLVLEGHAKDWPEYSGGHYAEAERESRMESEE